MRISVEEIPELVLGLPKCRRFLHISAEKTEGITRWLLLLRSTITYSALAIIKSSLAYRRKKENRYNEANSDEPWNLPLTKKDESTSEPATLPLTLTSPSKTRRGHPIIQKLHTNHKLKMHTKPHTTCIQIPTAEHTNATCFIGCY